jgi:hypothetical protein
MGGVFGFALPQHSATVLGVCRSSWDQLRLVDAIFGWYREQIKVLPSCFSVYVCHSIKLPSTKHSIHEDVIPQHPRNQVEVFRREDRPDEQMLSQHRAREHDRQRAPRREQRHPREVAKRHITTRSTLSDHPLPRRVPTHQHGRASDPPDRPRPVPDERQQADGADAVAADAVVGVGEVDGGDGVGAAEGEEGGVLQEEGGGGEGGGGGGEGGGEGEEGELGVEEQVEGDVECAGLGEQEEREDVVEGGEEVCTGLVRICSRKGGGVRLSLRLRVCDHGPW